MKIKLLLVVLVLPILLTSCKIETTSTCTDGISCGSGSGFGGSGSGSGGGSGGVPSGTGTGSGNLTITWPANSESDLAGYLVYYGTDPANPSFSIDVGNKTNLIKSAAELGLNAGNTYYFSIQAYDMAHNLSDRSFVSAGIQIL